MPFPDLDTIEAVPLRPSNPEENLLSSLQRGLMSSWSPDWLLNPGHRRALPAAVFWLGVLPLLARSRWREPAILAWLVVIALFWAGTLGPFLKPPGGQLDTAAVVLVGGEAVRLPWTWMFQWVPGMARMFAPYRMGAVVVVAAVALLALSLSRAPGGAWVRRGLGLVVVGATVLQAVWRWDIEDEGPDARRVQAPLQVSAIRLPDFYADLPVQAGAGLLELPLNQQQDLICLYQRFHGRKVYRGWATAGAVPPLFRAEGGGAAGARLRHLAAQDGYSREVDQALLRLSEDPAQADLSTLSDADLDLVLAAGGYRHVIVHERGYWLVDPQEGAARYRAAVAALADRLGVSAAESTDVAWFDHQANQPARVPWTASRVAVHDDALPRAFRMAVFDVGERVSGFEGVIPKIGNSAPGEAPRVHHEGASRDLLLVVVPGLSGDPAEGGPLAAFAAGLGRPPTERFLAAQAQSLSPFLGLGSLLTGRHAAALPLCSLNGGDPRMGENSATTWCSQLPRGIQTCPQGLGIVGYHTGATVADAGQLGDPERRDPLLVQLLGWWQAAAGQPRFGLLVVPDLALGDADPVETARGLGAGLDVVLDTLTERNEGVAPWVLLTSTTGRTGPEAPAWLGPGDVHVPLWVFDPAAPQGPPRDHAELVSLLDVAPTLWRLGGAPVPEDLPGADLFDERAPRGGAYTASGDRLAWREGDWLLSFRAGLDDAVALDPRVTDRLLNHDVDGGGWYRLHHVAPGADPTVDHLAAEPERAAQLRQGLLEARTGPAAPPADRLTPARLEALRRLNSGDPW